MMILWLLTKIHQIQNYFHGNKLIKSDWPYAAPPYLRGENLANDYRYAQLNHPLNALISNESNGIDIFNVIKGKKS